MAIDPKSIAAPNSGFASNALGSAAATPQQLHDALVNRLFQGNVYLRVGTLSYAAPNGNSADEVIQSVGPFAWRAVFAPQGYWLYRSDMAPNQQGLRGRCWQVNPTTGALKFWDFDGLAAGYPQDWEELLFEDAGGMTVRVKSVYGRYVGWNGARFSADAASASATVFTTEFP
jgi:hypothetical protein